MIKSNSVVVVGDHNPSIFSPAWIRNNVDITVDDGTDPQVQIIHPDIADFLLCDLRFTIERNRMVLTSMVHDIELLVAISHQIFSMLLSHTPIWAYGVNFERHVDFVSFENRNKLGRLLCPLNPWGEWGVNLDNSDPELNGGLASISMKKILSKSPERYQLFTIAPSNHKDMKTNGVFFQTNNHFALSPISAGHDPERRVELLNSMRENVLDYVRSFDVAVEHFMKLGGVDE